MKLSFKCELNMISSNLPCKVLVALTVHTIRYVEFGNFLTLPSPIINFGY